MDLNSSGSVNVAMVQTGIILLAPPPDGVCTALPVTPVGEGAIIAIETRYVGSIGGLLAIIFKTRQKKYKGE